MQSIKSKLGDLSRFTTPKEKSPDHEYEDYVNLTAKLIGRTYIATAKLVEKWPIEVIKRRYHDAAKDSNPAMRWWVLRKYNR